MRRLTVLAIATLAILRGDSYEIRPAAEANAVSVVQFAPAPLGASALLYGGNRLALFAGDGSSIDPVWWKPDGRFRLSHQGGKAHVNAKDWMKAGPAEFLFDASGRLTAFRRNAGDAQRERDSAVVAPRGRLTLRQCWPREKPQGDFWKGTSRMRLGYRNPNAAGTLFAELAVLALAGLAFLPGLWMRILSGAGLAASLTALFLTESRGSFVGFCLGAMILAFTAVARRFSFRKAAFWGCAVALVAGLAAMGAFGDRFGRNLLERGEGNMLRMECWKAAPAMMAAAPDGWGEKCGQAYCDWFQPLGSYHPQTWLFNSHLTWMVEHGWDFRFAYCSGWFMLLIVLGMMSKRSKAAVSALALWMAFAVAMWFSTVGHCWTLWILPACTLPLAAFRRSGGRMPHMRCIAEAIVLAFAFGAAVCIIIGVHGGRALGKMPTMVRHDSGVTTVGGGNPKTWVLRDDHVLSMGMTGAFGHELRDFLRRNPKFGMVAVTEDIGRIPADVDALVASGDAAREYMKEYLLRAKEKNPHAVKRLVLVSPAFPLRAIPPSVAAKTKLLFLSGELVKPLYLKEGANAPAWAKFVPGAGMYMPDWMDIAFKEGR